jgi:CxxC-x17-CxxC domain-containing protein
VSYVEKSLTCVECGAEFAFTVEEQEYHASRGYTNEPKRCPSCREARRGGGYRGGVSGPRQMYPVVCADCGQQTEVPFQPRGDRPVYCRDCFSKRSPTRSRY